MYLPSIAVGCRGAHVARMHAGACQTLTLLSTCAQVGVEVMPFKHHAGVTHDFTFGYCNWARAAGAQHLVWHARAASQVCCPLALLPFVKKRNEMDVVGSCGDHMHTKADHIHITSGRTTLFRGSNE